MNKTNIHNNIISSILSLQNGLNDLFSSTDFYFKSKFIEGSHKGKNNFGSHFQNVCFWGCGIFSCPVVIQSTQFFSGSTYL